MNASNGFLMIKIALSYLLRFCLKWLNTKFQFGNQINIADQLTLQVALTLHGFTLHDPHFTRGLCFCQFVSHYVVYCTISSLYTIKKHYLSIKSSVFHFTRISFYTIYSEKQKSCRVRATCMLILYALY